MSRVMEDDALRHAAVAMRSPGRRGGRSKTRDPAAWDLLLGLVAVLILTSVARIHLLFPVLAALQLTLVAGGGAVLLYLINHHPARRISALGSAPTVLLAVFTGWMIFTVPWGLRQSRGLMFVADNFLKTVIVYLVIVGCIRGVRDVERLAFVYFGGAALYAAVILAQYNLGDSWRLGNLITYDANDFALFAVTAIPLGVHLLGDSGRRLWSRLAVGAGLAMLAVAFVQSGSRGGFLAMGAVAVYLLVRHRAIPLRWRVGGIGLLGLVVAAFASREYWDQMTTLLNPGQDYNLTAETGRLQIWRRGLGYLWDNPVTGVGPSNFHVAEGVLSPMAFRQELGIGVPWTAPHNSFLQVAVELGIPGLLLFLGLLWAVYSILRKMEKQRVEGDPVRQRRGALAQAITGSLLGFLVGAVFLSLAYSAMLYTLAALAVGLWKTTGVGPDRLAGAVRHRRTSHRGGPATGEESTSFLTG